MVQTDTFKIIRGSEQFVLVCDSKSTRNGFCHTCSVINVDENTVGSARVDYMNRTWESYKYQSVIRKALRKAGFTDDEIESIDRSYCVSGRFATI